MSAKIFLTGATGYLGGEALYQLAGAAKRRSPPFSIRALVRDAQKGETVRKAFPQHVEIVQGNLDDAGLIQKEAGEADVVVHLASTRHEGSSRAVVEGLKGREGGGYWVQISGASMFSGAEIKEGRYGEEGNKVYDDLEGVGEVVDVIRGSPARVVDNLVLDQEEGNVRTALVPGPFIYGKARGPLNTRSIQGPGLVEYALKTGSALVLGEGKAAWSNVHVSDVGSLIVLLVEAALDGKKGLWNQNGIFFPENGLLTFGEVSKRIAEAASQKGLIKNTALKTLSVEETNEVMPHGAVLLGTNARVKSSRARKDLGWKPSGHSLEDEIPLLVNEESKRLSSKA